MKFARRHWFAGASSAAVLIALGRPSVPSIVTAIPLLVALTQLAVVIIVFPHVYGALPMDAAHSSADWRWPSKS